MEVFFPLIPVLVITLNVRSTNMLYSSVALFQLSGGGKKLFCTLFSILVTVFLESICSPFFGMNVS